MSDDMVEKARAAWAKDLAVMRQSGPVRWTKEQLDELQLKLNANELSIVSDAIGSLRFDVTDARSAVRDAVSEYAEFVAHKDECAFWKYRDCDCGLSALRKKFEVEG